ncbi:phosphatidate cytidylyltransferase [Mycoplasma sp. 4044]
MKNLTKRAFSATILFLILIPFVFITYYANFVGRIIGICFYIAFALWASWEIIKHFNIDLASKILLMTGILLMMLLPYEIFANLKNQAFWAIDSKILLNRYAFLAISFSDKLYFTDLIFAFIPFLLAMLLNIKKIIWSQWLIALLVLLIVPIFSKILFIVNVKNIYILLAIELVAVSVDTSAMLGGMAFGQKIIKRKFAPRLSPKKTWEGALCAFLLGSLAVYMLFCLPGMVAKNSITTIYTSDLQVAFGVLFLAPITIYADLLFSAFKRSLKIKDFSNLIPGHGGIMDRFDSVSILTIASMLIYTYL